MRNIKLLLEYDGTNYAGWQRQENGRTIQGELEAVLSKVLQEEVDVIGAGRTDAGVHARGQVANFHTNSVLTLREIHGALNGLLPDDIVVLRVEEVPDDFHARYSAKARTYSYLLALQPTALERNFSWYITYQLDVDLMQRVAREIVGQHDFASFCKAQSEVNDYRCTVFASEWTLSGTMLRYAITANRFLHGMVRALVGTMVDVGRGYTTADEFKDILHQRDRKRAGMAAPAKGLVLESVIY
jgi:tRNA pseudouridine38-40 synthase